ncbi:energy transducer TonB [Croceibacterium ferulae]|uniref:energy transducer TonB n=1 Tax=Croceibacterium ferulae TaxID=1854641 RepID=UPI001390397A|nr:energy transducer TonB [Croceibacterium ferulae]
MLAHLLLLAAAPLACLLSGPAHAAELALASAPGSNWVMDGAENSCRLIREFGEGDDRVNLLITQWSPGKSFSMVVAGRPLRRFDDGRPVEVQFGDAAGPLGPRPERPVKGTLGDNAAALIFHSVYLTPPPPDGANPAARPPEYGTAAPMLPPAARAAADRIELVQGRDRLRLEPTRLGDALAVLDDCSGQRLAEWGLDRAAHATMIQAPEPLNFEDLSRRIQRYYPLAARMRGEQGNLHMRMLVDEAGIATDCTITAASETSRITTNACEQFTAEGLFLPALDAAGKPMKSFYATSILFRMQAP